MFNVYFFNIHAPEGANLTCAKCKSRKRLSTRRGPPPEAKFGLFHAHANLRAHNGLRTAFF